jgi:hypothetical protein
MLSMLTSVVHSDQTESCRRMMWAQEAGARHAFGRDMMKRAKVITQHKIVNWQLMTTPADRGLRWPWPWMQWWSSPAAVPWSKPHDIRLNHKTYLTGTAKQITLSGFAKAPIRQCTYLFTWNVLQIFLQHSRQSTIVHHMKIMQRSGKAFFYMRLSAWTERNRNS